MADFGQVCRRPVFQDLGKVQFFPSPPFGSLKIFGAPPQYLHPPPLVILMNFPLHLLQNNVGVDHPGAV